VELVDWFPAVKWRSSLCWWLVTDVNCCTVDGACRASIYTCLNFPGNLTYCLIELLVVRVSNLGQDNICSDCIVLAPLSRILGRDLILNWPCPLHTSSSPLSWVTTQCGRLCRAGLPRDTVPPHLHIKHVAQYRFSCRYFTHCETVCWFEGKYYADCIDKQMFSFVLLIFVSGWWHKLHTNRVVGTQSRFTLLLVN
jgi:hypothetical protein